MSEALGDGGRRTGLNSTHRGVVMLAMVIIVPSTCQLISKPKIRTFKARTYI